MEKKTQAEIAAEESIDIPIYAKACHSDRPNASIAERFAHYLQENYDACETLGVWQLKGGVQSSQSDIYKRWCAKIGYNAASTLKWRRMDPDNLPKGEILMRNSADGMCTGIAEEWKGEIMGYLNYPDDTEDSRENWEVRGVEWYIPVSELRLLDKEE